MVLTKFKIFDIITTANCQIAKALARGELLTSQIITAYNQNAVGEWLEGWCPQLVVRQSNGQTILQRKDKPLITEGLVNIMNNNFITAALARVIAFISSAFDNMKEFLTAGLVRVTDYVGSATDNLKEFITAGMARLGQNQQEIKRVADDTNAAVHRVEATVQENNSILRRLEAGTADVLGAAEIILGIIAGIVAGVAMWLTQKDTVVRPILDSQGNVTKYVTNTFLLGVLSACCFIVAFLAVAGIIHWFRRRRH